MSQRINNNNNNNQPDYDEEEDSVTSPIPELGKASPDPPSSRYGEVADDRFRDPLVEEHFRNSLAGTSHQGYASGQTSRSVDRRVGGNSNQAPMSSTEDEGGGGGGRRGGEDGGGGGGGEDVEGGGDGGERRVGDGDWSATSRRESEEDEYCDVTGER